jgi:cytochrome c553
MGAGNALAEEAADHGGAVNAAEIVTTVCAMCHGEDGNKMLTPETPKLGGQKADYLARALHEYKDGGRKNPIMGAVSQPLSEAEIEALAAYYAAQPSQLFTLK